MSDTPSSAERINTAMADEIILLAKQRDEALSQARDERFARVTADALVYKLRNQLSRICKEGFGNDDTIGGEPADDYVLRMLEKRRNTHRELEWSEPNERGVMRGWIKGIPETTMFLIRINKNNAERGTMTGALVPDDGDGKGPLENGLIFSLKSLAASYVEDFSKKLLTNSIS
jgi:hypothetical protein